MPDTIPLNQYPLPNPGLPLGQQAVSPVASTNPLMSAASGVGTGVQLGLQAQQVAMQQKQVQIQQAQAMMQAKVQQAQILKEALGTAHQDFETLSKINPDMAVDYYHQKIAPMQDEFWGQYGLKMDSTQIPASHNNADVLTQANQLTDLALNDPSKIPIARAGLAHLGNQMDVGEMVQQKLANATKTVDALESTSKHQDDLAQQWVQSNQALRGDSVYKGLETQRNAAAQGYDTLMKNKPKGQYDLSNGQIIDLYGQLWKAQTGGVLSPAELDEMNQSSLTKNYAKLAGFIGLSKNALPQQVGDRLSTMFTNLGQFTDQQHSSMEAEKAAKPGGLIDPVKIQAAQQALGRGMNFQQMKDKTDQEYQAKNGAKTIQRRGKDGQVYIYTLNPKTGKYE